MKKILIIEDNQIVANVYRNKLAVEGYQVEVALDGETGLKLMRTFQPDMIILDLMLPKMSGVDVIKQIRSEAGFFQTAHHRFFQHLSDQPDSGGVEGRRDTNAFPRPVVRRRNFWNWCATPSATAGRCRSASSKATPKFRKKPRSRRSTAAADSEFQVDLRKSFIDSLPATLATLRADLQNLIKADREVDQLEQIYELYRRIHALTGNAGIVGLIQIAKMSAAFEALLKELYEKPKNINASTLRTVVAAVDFLGFLFERGIAPEKQELPAANILVVDDDPFPAAPSSMRWKRPISNASTSKTRTPPSTCSRKILSTSFSSTWTCPA